MKNIIIAEKPSVAQAYAKALGVSSGTRNDGFIENDKWIVTWTVGHLVTLSYPEKYDESLKEWKLETLPFIPGEFKYEVIGSSSKQFNVVKRLYNRSDINAIYYAGDSGREGLYIQMLVRMLAGHNPNAKELVVWIDSQTEDEILRGVNCAKDVSEYENMSKSGYMRAIEDYLVGINFSRLMSLAYAVMLNSAAGNKKQKPISVGRVMSCVLGMIVNRERAIRNFKVKNFYGIGGKILSDGVTIDCHWIVYENSKYYNSPKLYSDTGFNEASDANEFMSGLDNAIYITEIDRHIEKKNAPLLFNLAELQNECSKKLHLSSKETLNVAQSLYEKKLTTYPRTDARVLSTAISLEISKNVKGLKNGIYAKYAEVAEKNNCSLRGKYVDDSKITDHYAIIPTGKQPDQELSSAERQVYDLIVRRFLAVFYPAAEFDMVKFTGVCSGEHFVGSQKVLVKKGFLEIYSSSDGKDDDLLTDVAFPLKKDTAYEVNWDIKKGETKPPSRYTSGSIILAMENAGNLIEDEQLREQIKGAGVGTSATRADIIEKLISLDYISLNKMKQTITPTNFGEMIFEVLNAELPEMLSPQITAEWEQKLDNIANGSLSADDFKQEIFTYVRDKCNHIKETYVNNIPSVKDKIKPYATSAIRTEYKPFENWNTKLVCPLCGSEVETTAWGFKCKNNISKTEGCTFSVNGDILNHRLLTNELGELLKDGRSGPFYDFISPKGKPFAAFLLWNKDNKIEFDFTEMPWEKTELKCPVCGKDIVKRGNIYKCEGYIDRDNGCKFFIGKICGKSLNDKQIGNLVNNGTTDLITGFKNKEGDSFNAFLELDADKKIVFRFPTADDLKTDMKCPLCGGAIVATRFGFVCEKYKKKELRTDADCSFVAGTIFEHTVKEAELKKILSGGSTNFLQFKKDGKDFFARLYWDRVEKRIAFQFQDELDVKCPVCGKGLVKNKYGYCCSGRSAGCQFHVGAVSGILINEEQLKKLITTGKTDLIAGFKPKDKNKKPFSAYLMWNKDDGLSFDFDGADNGVSSYTTEYVCPVCHKEKIKEGKGSYYCSCGFKMFKNMSSVDIPVEQVNKLFTYGRTDVISGFFSPKKRKMFSVRLAIDDGKVVFSFLDTGNKHVIKEVGENVSE